MSQPVGAHPKTAVALYAAGGLLLLAAGALVALSLAGQAALATALSGAGISPGLLGVGAAGLIGLGAATRALGANRGAQAVPSFALDQLATEIATLRSQFQQVRDQQAQILAMGQAGAQVGQGPAADQLNAMFRIAASLDQLGARLDTGFKTHFASVDEKLNILARVLAGLRDSVQRGGAAADVRETQGRQEAAAAPPAPVSVPVSAQVSAPVSAPVSASAPRAGPTAAPRPAPTAVPRPAPTAAPKAALPIQPPAPKIGSLGILDHIDAPEPTADESGDGPMLIDLDSESAGASADSDASAAAKRSHLDALLPDDSVRRALGS
jgi:hypothetical protein